MKPKLSASLVALIAFLAVSIWPQTQGPGVPAGGVSSSIGHEADFVVTMDREPHHHLVLQNQYIRVFKVEIPPHSATLIHQHSSDHVSVTIGDSSIESDVTQKPPEKLELKDGDIRFTNGGFAHSVKNLSDRPFRNVDVEFLTSAALTTTGSCSVSRAGINACQWLGSMPRPGARITHSYDLSVAATDKQVAIGGSLREDGFNLGLLIVMLSHAVQQRSRRNEPVHPGDIFWIAPGDSITFFSTPERPLRLIQLNLAKPPNPPSS